MIIIVTIFLAIFTFILIYFISNFAKFSFVNIIYFSSISCLLIIGLIILLKVFFSISNIMKFVTEFENQNVSFERLSVFLKKYSLSNLFNILKDTINKEYSAAILKKQAEINYLESQISPHFLYNTLESIRGKAIVEGVDDIAEMTEALATFFRYSISQKGNIVTLEDELDNVDNYFIIQQYRFNNKFNISKIIYESDIKVLDCLLPKLTIQPIVENAIYHGLETKIGKGNITIRVTVTEERLILNIVDDGKGIPQAKLDVLNKSLTYGEDFECVNSRKNGIALTNVNERIKLNYGKQYGITVYSSLGFGTDVEIVLPLINNNGKI